MSGPYNQGGYGSYPNQQQYGGNYTDPNAYPQQPQYGQSQGYDSQSFGPPQRQDSFGPPQHGGFQQGIQGHQYGNYQSSNPQGHSDYYGQQQGYGQQPQYGQEQYGQQQQYGGQTNDAYAANQAYQQSLSQGGTAAQPDLSNHQFSKQSTDPNAPNYDPNAPPMTEQDRGLLGALGGGFAGHHFGKKSDHGILGTIGGAIVGSFAEDFLKKKKHGGGGSSWGGSGGSSWGGKY